VGSIRIRWSSIQEFSSSEGVDIVVVAVVVSVAVVVVGVVAIFFLLSSRSFYRQERIRSSSNYNTKLLADLIFVILISLFFYSFVFLAFFSFWMMGGIFDTKKMFFKDVRTRS
jgi:sterol desaturase/sphingolipid hydroxylase (fatty acid hydroxylase superfamily)